MKRFIILTLAVLMTVGLASIALAEGSGAGIVGSPHDFTDNKVAGATGTAASVVEVGTGGWNGRAEICRVCHVPHDHGQSTQYYLNGLLWNHGVSTATYTLYDQAWSQSSAGGTLDGTPVQPTGVAKLCLGCHDGTVGVDTFDKYAGGSVYISDYDGGFTIPHVTDGSNLDLRGTHPISINYIEGNGMRLKSTAMNLDGSIDTFLDNGMVQCSTCHDVHDKGAVAGTHLLRVTTKMPTPSALCLVCHDKGPMF